MGSLNKKNILFLTHSYSGFQKSQIESISKYFMTVYVLVRFKPVSYLSYIFPSNFLKHSRRSHQIDTTNLPNNICIKTVPVFYLPNDKGYRKLGKKHYDIVNKIIYNNDIKFDIIHSHYFWSAGYVGYKLKKEFNKPFVLTGHGYDVYRLPFKNSYWKSLISNILNSADAIFTNSNANKRCIDKIGNYSNIHISPIGVNENIFFPSNKSRSRMVLNLPLNKTIILCVGSFVYDKGHQFLIKAIINVLQVSNDILCIILGGGQLKKDLKRRINYYGLNNYVKLIGKKNHSSIPMWINSCDIFVLPSLNEGMPDSMFEAMACGKPFVGTSVGGIPEVINDEVGYLAEPGNSDDLSDKIINALNNKWDYNKITKMSRKFTLKNNREDVIKCYNNLINNY